MVLILSTLTTFGVILVLILRHINLKHHVGKGERARQHDTLWGPVSCFIRSFIASICDTTKGYRHVMYTVTQMVTPKFKSV